jgi:hypothetical protein
MDSVTKRHVLGDAIALSFGAVDDHDYAFEPFMELPAAAMGFEYLLKFLCDFLVTVREGQIEG